MALDNSFNAFLSSEEAETLDVAAAQRLMGKLDKAIVDASEELRKATLEFGEAKTNYNVKKFYVNSLVERARNLKNFIRVG